METFMNQQNSEYLSQNIEVDVLQTCLDSLHYYLLHEEKADDSSRLRFQSNPLQFTDEMDEFADFFVRNFKKTDDIVSIWKWIKSEEYDWDSIICDIEGIFLQSNMYALLQQYNKETDFKLLQQQCCQIESKYSKKDLTSNQIMQINYGISVLNWFKYDEKAKHKNFIDEIKHNKYAMITSEMLSNLMQQCKIKLETSETLYTYTLNELLSLKLYTDTNELCSLFRRAHWKDGSMMMKREFYWWGLNIYKSALYHSRPLPRFSNTSKEPVEIYHGVNQILATSESSPKFNGPVSTSIEDTVAQQFSNETGLMWCIKTSYQNPFKFVTGIDVSWISCHKHEAEILLVDQYLHIHHTSDFSDHETQIRHLFKRLCIYSDKIDDPRTFWKQMGFKLKESEVAKPSLLFQTTEMDSKSVFDRLIEELNMKKK
eukprot:181359_1